MNQLLVDYRPEKRFKPFSGRALSLLVVVVTGIALYATVRIAHGLSREFEAWLEALPAAALVPALILGCGVWLMSLYRLVRPRQAKGNR